MWAYHRAMLPSTIKHVRKNVRSTGYNPTSVRQWLSDNLLDNGTSVLLSCS